MSLSVDPNHPKCVLLFFVAQDLNDSIRANVREFVLQLASVRRWLNGPPRFVNSREEPADTSRGDLPVETIGGYVEIYSTLPPWKLPREIERQQLDEVTALTNMVCDFSLKHDLSIEFEFNGELIGAIDDGKMDRALTEGLIGEWKRKLEAH